MTRAPIDHQRRDDILAAAAIRAMLCASRGLSQSQACHPPGCEHCSNDPSGDARGHHTAERLREQLHPVVCEWLPSEDSEGGTT